MFHPAPLNHVLHVISLFVLLGYTFYAFGAPPETRKRVLMITGIATVLVLVTGIGMVMELHLGFPGWVIVKLVCWLGLAALAGFGYRRREKVSLWIILAVALCSVALVMVYYKPF